MSHDKNFILADNGGAGWPCGRQGPVGAGQIHRARAEWACVLRVQGYEAWQTIAVSQNGDLIEVILGNPAMIKAYQAGLPAVAKQFPDGVKMAKIHWKAKKSADEPGTPTVPGS
jgi:hypothetical protein